MVDVIKRDGTREPFTPEKIVVSAMKSGAPNDEARRIAGDVEKSAHEGMTTEEIRGDVLRMLRERNPEWERNWLIYDRAVKRRAGGEPAMASR